MLIAGQVHVTRQTQRQQPDVGVALNIGVPAQSVDPATRHADVAEQQLDHPGAANHLHAAGVMGPAQRIQERSGAIWRAGFADDAADFQKVFFWRAADVGHHLGCVTADVLFEQVPDTAGVAIGFIAFGKTVGVELVHPFAAFVLLLGRVKAAEQALLEGVAVAHDQRRVGVGAHVFMMDTVVGDQVMDHAHQEGDVGTGANGRENVSHGRAAVEARVDDDDFGAIADLGFDHPLETYRVRFSRVTAHDQHHVGVLDVDPIVGHGAPAQRRRKCRYRRGVTQPCLAVDAQHAQRTGKTLIQKTGFITGSRRAQHARGQPAVNGHAVSILLNEVGIAVIFH